MKSKKILATLLAVMLMASCFALTVSATHSPFTDAYPSSVGEFGIAAPSDGVLLKGDIIGGSESLIGGWSSDGERNPDTSAHAAFDGDSATFFDPMNAQDSDDFTGIKVSEPYILTEIRLLPRSDQLSRHEGAAIWGFNDDVFDPAKASLIFVSDEGADEWEFQVYTVKDFIPGSNTGFTHFAYYNEAQHGDILEIELYGNPGSIAAGAPVPEYTIKAGKNVVEAEHFDSAKFEEHGATGESYTGRPEMQGVGPQSEACSNDRADAPAENFNLGWTDPGEWVQYTVNFEKAGKATFSAWVAGGNADAGIVEVLVGNDSAGKATSAGSDGWQAWVLSENFGSLDVKAGKQVIKVIFENGNVNIDALVIDFVEAAAEEPAAPAEEPPANDNAAANAGDDGETPAAADDKNDKDTASDKGDDEGGVDMILWIVLGAAAVVIIVIIVIIVTKKKK